MPAREPRDPHKPLPNLEHMPGCAFDANKPHESTGSCMPDCPIGGHEARKKSIAACQHTFGKIVDGRCVCQMCGASWTDEPMSEAFQAAQDTAICLNKDERERFLRWFKYWMDTNG